MFKLDPVRRDEGAPRPAPRRTLPDFYMPAMPPVTKLEALVSWFGRWRQARRQRRQLRRLLALEDHLLTDLGFSREELTWGLRRPLREDATRAIAERRHGRRVEAVPRRRRTHRSRSMPQRARESR